MINYLIEDLQVEDRPRERLLRWGPDALTTLELIAIILGSGTKQAPVMELAQQIIARFGSLEKLSQATVSELCEIKGVGPAKAVLLKAAFNLGVRASKYKNEEKIKIGHPLHAYQLVKDLMEKETREFFVIILLDVKSFFIAHEIVSIGDLSQTIVHPREVFYPAVRHKAASIILAHNHPSGDLTPSDQDHELTRMLISAAALMGIPVFDHIIIGKNNYFSYKLNKLL